MTHQTIIVLDFGSQFTQLIARRLRELSVYSEVWPPNTPIEKIRERNPVGIITKNQLVTRDIDLLGELAGHDAAAVNISVTSLDPQLQRVLEPRAGGNADRCAVQLRALALDRRCGHHRQRRVW